MAEIYAAYNTVLNIADALAPEIAGVINSLNDRLSAIKAKKEATKKLLSESDLSKLPQILDNCRDISSQSQVVQDSLEKAICDIKSGKLKAQLSKLEEARDANIAFMNELGPALANCQNIQFEPWKSKPCSGPCNFEWEQAFSFDSTQCKKGLRKALNVKCINYYETPITVQSVRRTGSPSWFAYCNQVGFKESLSTFARDYCEASVITNKKFAKTKTGIGSVNASGDWEPCLDEVQLSASELSSVKEEAIAEALEVAAIQWARYTAGEYFSPQVSDIAISFVPFVNVANDLRQLPFSYYYSATGISDLKKAGHWTGVIGGLVMDMLETRGALKFIETNPSILGKGFETFKRYFTGMQSVGKAFIRPGLRINKQSRAYAMIIPFPTVNLSDNFKSALDEINKLLYEGKLDGNLVKLTGGVDSQGNLLGEIEISNQKVTVLLSEDEAKLIKFAQEGVNPAGDELTTLLLNSGEDFTVLTNARKLPGVSTGAGKDITGTWLRGSEMNAGLFPKSVADKLRGRTFNTFDDFRSAFWKEVTNDPNLLKQFSPKDIAIMKNGYAPAVLESQRIGGNIKYVLHHKTPINRGGAVYDVDNLYIVTPKYHKEILDPAYHFGYGY